MEAFIATRRQMERLSSVTWCECSAGYSQQVFEKASGCKADATMLNSVKCVDEICLMKNSSAGEYQDMTSEHMGGDNNAD